jgi:hypothetical protein
MMSAARKQVIATPPVEDRIKIPTLPGYILKATRGAKEAAIEGEVVNIGLDVGYGVTKALTWGFDPVLFRSLYGYARGLGYDERNILDRHPGDAITTTQGDWFVGELAATQLREREQLSLRGRDNANEIRLLMALVAIGKLFSEVYRPEPATPLKVRIATGLPVTHMKGASALKEALIGRHEVHTDQSHFTVDIMSVSVMPQPNGTINAVSLLPNGAENPRFIFRKIGVVDNGTFSVDVATEEDGLFIGAESGTKETGLHTAYEQIAILYNDEFGEMPSQRTVERILANNGKFKAGGEPQDWSKQATTVLKPMRDATITLCREAMGKASEHEIILNVGGPAPLVKDLIDKEYRQAFMPPESQMTNALGYLHYAAFVAGEE